METLRGADGQTKALIDGKLVDRDDFRGMRTSLKGIVDFSISEEGVLESRKVAECEDYYQSFPERENLGIGPDKAFSRCLGKANTLDKAALG